jgi:hypothetical protein
MCSRSILLVAHTTGNGEQGNMKMCLCTRPAIAFALLQRLSLFNHAEAQIGDRSLFARPGGLQLDLLVELIEEAQSGT